MIFKTVRCIIKSNCKYLLAIHNNTRPETIGKWGLVGGHIEQGELFEITAIREVQEELNLQLERLTEIGDYHYDNALHKVFAVDYKGSRKITFDPKEILDLHWFSLAEIKELNEKQSLHTGFEFKAIQAFETFETLSVNNSYGLKQQVATHGLYYS